MEANRIIKDIDYEDEYSRLLGVLGEDALKKFQSSKILLIGLKGLGAEIAKNAVLVGARSLTIQDKSTVQVSDLSSSFLLSEADVGKNRAEASLPRLLALNGRTDIRLQCTELVADDYKQFDVVCVTHAPSLSYLIDIDTICRTINVPFIAGETFGAFGFAFNDLGDAFTTFDSDGEKSRDVFIERMTRGPGDDFVVTAANNGKGIPFAEGDDVRMCNNGSAIDGAEFRVNLIKDTEISVTPINGSYSGDGSEVRRGHFEKIRRPLTLTFAPLATFSAETISREKALLADRAKAGDVNQSLLLVHALYAFKKTRGQLPRPWHETDARDVVATVNDLNNMFGNKIAVDEQWVKTLAKVSSGELAPMASIIGSAMSQEIIKAVTHWTSPLDQFLFFDCAECLPDDIHASEIVLSGTRYDGQIAVLGPDLTRLLHRRKVLLAGAGCIGCEHLKHWALMGVGSNQSSGLVTVVDSDTVGVHHLNSQLLYNRADISSPKAEAATKAVLKLNGQIKIRSLNVDVTEESQFDEWSLFDCVFNACGQRVTLSKVEEQCVFFRKPFVACQALGAKGRVQTIVPFLTESLTPFGQRSEPPVSKWWSFPSTIDDSLQWARDGVFDKCFATEPRLAQAYLQDPDSPQPSYRTEEIFDAVESCVLNRPQTLDACIQWARLEFERRFNHNALSLLHAFPLDKMETSGPFWSGNKRPPKPLTFDPADPIHVQFVATAAELRARVMGIVEHCHYERAVLLDRVKKVSLETVVPPFRVVDLRRDKGTLEQQESVRAEQIKAALENAPSANKTLTEIHFNKDDRLHIDFIHMASTLRARAYAIPEVERNKSRLIAGEIVPKIITTSALLSGLACLELIKPLPKYRNSLVNLAAPSLVRSVPLPPARTQLLDRQFTLWDRVEVHEGDLTVQQFMDYIRRHHKVVVEMIGSGSSLLYAPWQASSRARVTKNMTELYVERTHEQLNANKPYLVLQLSVAPLEGDDDDLDFPEVLFYYSSNFLPCSHSGGF